MTTKPLLHLTTDDEVKTVVINNTEYVMNTLDRLGLRELRTFHRLAESMVKFQNLSSDDAVLSDDFLEAFDVLLRDCIPLILPELPDNLRMNLKLPQRMDIAHAFLVESGLVQSTDTENRQQRRSKTQQTRGGKSSHSLSTSTVVH